MGVAKRNVTLQGKVRAVLSRTTAAVMTDAVLSTTFLREEMWQPSKCSE